MADEGDRDDGPHEEEGHVVEEECAAEFKPVVQLGEVDTKTGEEDEDILFKMRAKLFRFSSDTSEWKERGVGDVKILQHKENKLIRLLMRRDKTLKICLNHYVNKDITLHENAGSDRAWMWNAIDYAEGEKDECVLAIRFANSENAQKFKEAYDQARQVMNDTVGKAEETPAQDEDGTEGTNDKSNDSTKEDSTPPQEEKTE